MSIANGQSLMRALRRLAKAFGRDARGLAAVEFGYMVPIILLILIGTIEASRALAVDRRYGMVTAMVADLVGRETKLTADDVTAIYNIVAQVMRPFDPAPLKISLIPVKASATDASNTKVYASTTNRPSLHGGEQLSMCASYPLESGLVGKGESVIVVKTSYEYTPLLIGSLFGSSTWTEEAIVSPRNSCVDFDDNNCVSACF